MSKEMIEDTSDEVQTLFTIEVLGEGLIEEAREGGGQLRVLTPFGRPVVFNYKRVSKNKVALICDDATTEQADYLAQIHGYKVEGHNEMPVFIAEIDDHFLQAERDRSTKEAQKLGIPSDLRDQTLLMRELILAMGQGQAQASAAPAVIVPLVTRQALAGAGLDTVAVDTLVAMLEEAGVQIDADIKAATIYFEAARLGKVDPKFNAQLAELIDESDYRQELAQEESPPKTEAKRGRPSKVAE